MIIRQNIDGVEQMICDGLVQDPCTAINH